MMYFCNYDLFLKEAVTSLNVTKRLNKCSSQSGFFCITGSLGVVSLELNVFTITLSKCKVNFYCVYR